MEKEKIENKTGVITDCLFAPEYKEPDENSEIVQFVMPLEKLKVIPFAEAESKGFYKIGKHKGRTGFVKKEFVTIAQKKKKEKE